MDRKQYEAMTDEINRGNPVVFNGRRALTLDRLDEIIAQGGDSIPADSAKSETVESEGVDSAKSGKSDK